MSGGSVERVRAALAQAMGFGDEDGADADGEGAEEDDTVAEGPEPEGPAEQLTEAYLRTTRRARAVMERAFYDD